MWLVLGDIIRGILGVIVRGIFRLFFGWEIFLGVGEIGGKI